MHIEFDGEFHAVDGDGGSFGLGDFDTALDILAEGGDAFTGKADGDTEDDGVARGDDHFLRIRHGRTQQQRDE